ncbi:GIY-YIG nuclease family protein [Aspergillus alliaceus]|uniref:GIY-YIG nuclease family protein n=1 Tax=Petromyces alliaceus TaxID=209559 RepID=UPI0012A71CBB|nr:uncharacterized protein BDW43DRAFT_263304 [Aspergillus alliaceus]KAB8238231.1 hypothetical protein BDW43DRAFT_263304 [Aspergillus alliaceus]
MPAKERYFIPFRHLSPSLPEYTAECAAHKNNGKRCTSMVQSHNIPEINRLHARLQISYETTNNDERREEMLRKLAKLTICGHQTRVDGVIEAAVHQWNFELQPQDGAAVSLETPPRNVNAQSNDDKGSSKLKFTPYQKTNIDKPVADALSHELDRMVDRNIGQKIITHDWKHERDYLYIFECEEAEGMCKLGRTYDLSRRASEHEKCYPNLTQRWSLYCPNAEVFERVVQLEFSRHRYKHECLKCNVTHTEWFKTDIDDIYQRVKVWCQFSKGLQSHEKRSQVSVPVPGFSSDPDRWYKWAQKWVQLWDEKVSHTEPNTSGKSVVDNVIVTGEDLNLDDDAESVPGLSPSSSAPGAPDDDYSDPPTPTPIERSRNGKPILGQRLIIPAASPSVSPEVYWTPAESMSTPKGRVLFPRLPGAYPVSPVKVEDENGLADILENVKLF